MVKFFYSTVLGRVVLWLLLHTHLLKLAAFWVRRPSSKILIKPFIKRNQIDMREFAGQEYACYADFFARRKKLGEVDGSPEKLISPCDSLLSIFTLENGTKLHIKNSYYGLDDLIPDEETAAQFEHGLCLIFRLRASDYHHFCYVDDCYQNEVHFVPGLLHSVQPIACEKVPVYCLNRRSYSVLDTEHFGRIAQIEVGALLVGGMVHEHECEHVRRGQEMGYFELAGSTIILLLQKGTAEKILFMDALSPAWDGKEEIEVKIGQVIGRMQEKMR